ncbi:GDYXXLXY domain-containing protein, partial [Mesorhizobium sp. M7A.F.Ca.CA.004.11.1.1]
MITGKRLVISALVLALVQIGFLSWIIAGRAAILRNGKEVLLKIEPVDPRDLLRGDYIILGYDISRIPVKMIANIPPDKLSSDDTTIVVRLNKGSDNYWQ